MRNLQTFLDPGTIAVVGASRDRHKPGNRILRNIIDGGFRGTVYPVNPSGSEIEGLTAYRSVAELPPGVDLAVIVLGQGHVEHTVQQCVQSGVRSVVVVTAGFGEGDETGQAAQQRMRDLTVSSGTVAIGPNTIGYINKEANLFVSFVAFQVWHDGSVALVAQSGVYAGAVVHELMARTTQKVGIRLSVDVGNRLSLTEHDLLKEFGGRADLGVLGFYVEEFSDLGAFMAAAAQVTPIKPVIVLKSGVTTEGAQAAWAHTGSIAGDDAEIDSQLRTNGIIRAQDNAEFVSLLRTFEYCPLPRGRRVGVVTFSGGLGIVTADALVQAGMELSRFAPETISKLEELAPDWQRIGNPADLWSASEADPGRAATLCYPAVIEDPNVDQLLFVLLAMPNMDFDGMTEVFADLRARRPDVPVHVTMDGALRDEWTTRLEGLGVVVHDSARTAARAMSALSTYAEHRGRNSSGGRHLARAQS